jgi:uncharacterized protein YceH (UPF0502 family)
MSTPDTLLQAALNRLAARASSSAIDAVAQLSLLAQDAPQKLRTDLQLFWEEVQDEAQRLDGNPYQSSETAVAADSGLQEQVDGLRKQVAAFSRELEGMS